MKPDYSLISPMACKFESTKYRDEIIDKLKEMGVPDIHWQNSGMCLLWSAGVVKMATKLYYNGNTPETFLSKFREVYNTHIAQFNRTDIPMPTKEIVFPDDEWLDSIFTSLDSKEIKIAMAYAVEKHRIRIQELNR